VTEFAASIPNIDIRPEHWQIVRHILRLHVPNFAVWAFGSRAKWTAKPHSDLDLAVITEKPLPLSVSASLSDDFSESNLPWKVDVVDWATTSASFREIIARDKVILQEPGQLGSWRETTLGDICKQQGGSIQTGPFGSQLHACDYTQTGIPVVMPINIVGGRICEQGIARVSENMANSLARHQLKHGDIVFSRRGDVTRFALVSERETSWLCGTGCLKVSVGNPTMAISPFVAAVLALPESKEWLIRHAVGATMPNLNTEILGSVPVTLPPLADQRAIAHILGTLDDRIENLRQTNATLQAMAQALFKSWFVDFDGVPPEAMQQSELGLIPKGWRVGTLGDLCELNAAKWTVKKHPPSVRYIDLSGVCANRIEAAHEFAFAQAPSRARLQLREGDTIIGTVRPGNRAFAYIHAPDANLTGSTGFAVLSPKKPHYASFIYLAATRDAAIERLANLADGAAYPAVRPNVVAETPCVIAYDKTIAEFSTITKPLLERIEKNNQQSRTLAALRDTLLPRLISGTLRIRQW